MPPKPGRGRGRGSRRGTKLGVVPRKQSTVEVAKEKDKEEEDKVQDKEEDKVQDKQDKEVKDKQDKDKEDEDKGDKDILVIPEPEAGPSGVKGKAACAKRLLVEEEEVGDSEFESGDDYEEEGEEVVDKGKSKARGYVKSRLTHQQEVQLMEWYKENPVLYDKGHSQSYNGNHKTLLKNEMAEKMKITGEFNICRN